jgi:hypothetical protein
MNTTRYEIYERLVLQYLHPRLFSLHRSELISCFVNGKTPIEAACFIICLP